MDIINEEIKPLTKEDRVGFWTRFAAYLIDIVFTFIIGFILSLILGDLLVNLLLGAQLASVSDQMGQLGGMSTNGSHMFAGFMNVFMKWMAIAAGASFAGLILILMEGSIGQSIGKMILGIRITNVYGNRADPKTLWTRTFLKYSNNVLALIGGLTGVMIINTLGSICGLVIFVGFFLAFMDSRQTIHDMLAKTIVARVKR